METKENSLISLLLEHAQILKRLSNASMETLDNTGKEAGIVEDIPDLTALYTAPKLTQDQPEDKEQNAEQKAGICEALKVIQSMTTGTNAIIKSMNPGECEA